MAPGYAWSTSIQGSLIGVEHVNIIGSLGDVMEGRLQNTSGSPGGLDLDSIKQQGEEWLELLPNTGLPVSTQALVAQAIEQLLWTIGHADTFGLARVANDADQVTGVLALSSVQVPEPARAAWSQRLTRWAGTLIVFTGLMTATHGALESAGQVVKELSPVVQGVVQVVDSAVADAADSPKSPG